jgi:hypothetical protein
MTFKIIPTDYIMGLITKTKIDAIKITNSHFANSGYGESDLLKNLGMYAFAIIGLVIIIGVLILFKLL